MIAVKNCLSDNMSEYMFDGLINVNYASLESNKFGDVGLLVSTTPELRRDTS